MKRKMTDNKINTLLVSQFAEHLLSIGALNEKDLHSKQRLAEKIIKYARSTEFVSVTDHTEELLVWAKEFSESGNLDLAILFYATYYEHALNNLVDHVLGKNGVSEKSKNALIRSVNIAGKCGWLLEILALPAMNVAHSKRILQVADERNAFVHYKWGRREESKARKEEMVVGASKTATYLKRYTSRALYAGKKGKLKKTLTSKRSTRP